MKRILSMLLCLALVIGFIPVFTMPTQAAETKTFEKVTSAPSDWSGEYLIVYEGGNVAFNGGLATLDAVSNTVAVTISNGEIAANDTLLNATFTIEAVSGGYSIKSASGKYIGRTSNSNELDESTSTKYTNTITLNSDGSAHIVGSGNAVLRYNATSGQTRFRYYKSSSYSSQKAIHLYKLVENTSGGETPCDHATAKLSWQKNDTQHWQECECGDYTTEAADHDFTNSNTCVCGQVKPAEPDVPATGTSFVKVTEEPTDWSGEYLIVYEDGPLAFNGSLTTLDASGNGVAVEIADNAIGATDITKGYAFTIAKSGDNYTIKSASGYYIGQTSDANGLKANQTTTYENTLSINADGSVNIVSGGAYLRYNSAAGSSNLRYRYYKSSTYTGQKAIALYKLVETTGCDGTNHTYVDGTCSCGDKAIKMASGTLLYENNIQVRIKFSLADATADAKGMMIFSNPTDAAAHTNPVLMCDFSYDGDNNCYYSYSQGIVAKDMGISAYYVGYAKYGDTYVYTDVLEYSPKIYAQNMLNSDTSAEKTKNLCAALLHYGAAAQKYFDNSLTAEQLMNYNVANLPAFTYDESVLGTSNFAVETGEVNGFTVTSANILFDDAITYRIKYIPNAELQGKDLNMEFVIDGIYSAVPINEAGYAYIERKAPKDMDDVIICTPYYLEADGITKVCGPTLTYSGYEYVRRTIENSNDENMIALAKAFAMYIHCANEAFAN